MSYIARTFIPKDQTIAYALSNIYGIGLHHANILAKRGGFGLDSRGKDISPEKALELNDFIKRFNLNLGKDLWFVQCY